MNHARTLILAALAALAPAAVSAGPTRAPQAEIPFAGTNVRDWRAEGDRTIYFEDLHRRWFKATLFAPSFDLPFVEAIGIDAGPTGSLDNFGAVIIKGKRYAFDSFVAVAGPPEDKRKPAKPHKLS